MKYILPRGNNEIFHDIKHIKSAHDTKIDFLLTLPLANSDCDKVIAAGRTKQANTVARIISDIPAIYLSTKKTVLKEIDDSCKHLCKRRGNGSLLLDNSYHGLAEFSYERLWKELSENNPFLVDTFNSVSGKTYSLEDTPEELRTKYSFIYSILMRITWHKISLVQRLNTVQAIEGGCSKQVKHNKVINTNIGVYFCM